jgi:hypothetical protein
MPLEIMMRSELGKVVRRSYFCEPDIDQTIELWMYDTRVRIQSGGPEVDLQ